MFSLDVCFIIIEYYRHFWNKQKQDSAETTRAWTSRRSPLQSASTVSDACWETIEARAVVNSVFMFLIQSAPLTWGKLGWCFGISEDKKNCSLYGIRWHRFTKCCRCIWGSCLHCECIESLYNVLLSCFSTMQNLTVSSMSSTPPMKSVWASPRTLSVSFHPNLYNHRFDKWCHEAL